MSDETKPYFSELTYIKLKVLTDFMLPLFGLMYFGLSKIADYANVAEALAIILFIILLFEILLNINAKRYYSGDSQYDGQMVVTTDATGKKTISLELNKEPIDLAASKMVSFKVTDTPSVDYYEDVD